MAKLLETLLSNYKDYEEKELSDIVGLLALEREEIKEQSNIFVKTLLGFQVAIELFCDNEKIDLIEYNNGKGQLGDTYNYSIFYYLRDEHSLAMEEEFQIMVENRWSYYDYGNLIEEFDHDYYSLPQWREKVLSTINSEPQPAPEIAGIPK